MRCLVATGAHGVGSQALSLSPVHRRIEEIISRAGDALEAPVAHVLRTPGKLLRPTLVLLSAETILEAESGIDTGDLRRVGDDDGVDGAGASSLWEAVYDFAAAVELVHVASLVHDDVIDAAKTRRGRPSVNALFDNHTAVLAGDYLFASAFGLLAPHATSGVVSLMTEAIAQMCRGEMMQKESLFDPHVSEKAYLDRVQAKTASLLAAACEGGARLAGASDATCQAFREYGNSLGVAFQIADDILDLERSAKELGKPACADLRQGVITLPVIRLLQDGEWSAELAPHILSRRIGDDVVALVQDRVKSTGALEWARQVGYAHARCAASRLAGLTWTRAGAALAALCDEVMRRRR